MRAIPMQFQEYISLIQSGSLHSVFIERIGPRNGYNVSWTYMQLVHVYKWSCPHDQLSEPVCKVDSAVSLNPVRCLL